MISFRGKINNMYILKGKVKTQGIISSFLDLSVAAQTN